MQLNVLQAMLLVIVLISLPLWYAIWVTVR